LLPGSGCLVGVCECPRRQGRRCDVPSPGTSNLWSRRDDMPAHDQNGPDQAVDAQHTGNAALTFPDMPRLELDQLLDQLVARAQEVRSTQGRLRGLLRANQAIVADLGLETVLLRIVEAAQELVGARYAALGVLAPEGGLAEFVHAGMPSDTVARIGHLPQGKGLLGALIDDPRPIRLRDIADDPRSSGFPPQHPPMHSFLGVPIRIREEVFGNLYLSESDNGQFSVEDEELTKALAATAAAAIENARLYEAARTRGEWRQASASIARQVLSSEVDDPLRVIAEISQEIARADVITIVMPAPDSRELRVEVMAGAGADVLVGLDLSCESSLAGRVFSSGEPIRVASRDDVDKLEPMPPGLPDLNAVMAVPLRGTGEVRGVLTAARVRGRLAFTVADLEGANGFANQAALALELAEARAEQRRAEMLDERERIAADLHDHVIQRLFAAGLSLQAVAAGLGSGRQTDRIMGTIKDLDDTISQIRTTIFQLQLTGQTTTKGLRVRMLDVVAEVSPALGFDPAVRFAGLLEGTVADDLAEDLLAVVREALSNVARHARASSAEVEVTAKAGTLTLDVRDDGVGLQPSARRSGLANLRRRAEHHGGTLSLQPCEPSGTWLQWRVPI
jgi:signal transduction histidine kinase